MLKHRITDSEIAKEIIYSFHGRKIEVFNGEKWLKYAIKRIIPMQKWKGNYINDVEILLEKKRNYYFSIGMFLKGKSWVKSIRIGGFNVVARKMEPVWPLRVLRRNDDWIRTAKYIELLKMKIA